jgi:hypothetical protein
MNKIEIDRYNKRTQCRNDIVAKFRVARINDYPKFLTIDEIIKRVWVKKSSCQSCQSCPYSKAFISQQMKGLGFQSKSKYIRGKITGNTYSMSDGMDKIVKVWIVMTV